jgi:putative Holliday junction resolvase
MGIDFGERRIGIAISDAHGLTAQPVRVIERESKAQDVAKIKEMAVGRKAERIVVGLPLNMDGSSGPSARGARRFANLLRRELELEVVMWDERLTTVEADRILVSANERRDRRRQLRDSVAAAILLQDYLDSQERGPQP